MKLLLSEMSRVCRERGLAQLKQNFKVKFCSTMKILSFECACEVRGESDFAK